MPAGNAAYHVPEDLSDLWVGERRGLHVVWVEEGANGVHGSEPVDLVMVRFRIRIRIRIRLG